MPLIRFVAATVAALDALLGRAVVTGPSVGTRARGNDDLAILANSGIEICELLFGHDTRSPSMGATSLRNISMLVLLAGRKRR